MRLAHRPAPCAEAGRRSKRQKPVASSSLRACPEDTPSIPRCTAGFTFRLAPLPGETNHSSAVLKGGPTGTVIDPRWVQRGSTF